MERKWWTLLVVCVGTFMLLLDITIVNVALPEGLGWASIFYINVPVGIVAASLTMTKLAESSDPAQSRLDWIGTVTFTASLFTFVLAVIRGNSDGWGSTKIVTLFAVSAVMMVLFLISQVVQK